MALLGRGVVVGAPGPNVPEQRAVRVARVEVAGAGGDVQAAEAVACRGPGGLGLAPAAIGLDGAGLCLHGRGAGVGGPRVGLDFEVSRYDGPRRQGQHGRGGQAGQRRVAAGPPDQALQVAHGPGADRLAGQEAAQVVGQRGGRGVALARLLLQALQAIVSRSRGRPGSSRDGGTGSVA